MHGSVFMHQRVQLKTWRKGEQVNEKERENQSDFNPQRMNLKQKRRDEEG